MKKLLATIAIALLALSSPMTALAARLDTIGMETDNTTAATLGGPEWTFNGLYSAPDGVSTGKVHSGTYSLYFGQTSAAQFSWMAYKFHSAASAASTTVGAFIYLNTVYAQTQEIFTLANEGPGALYSLKLNSSNQLCMFDSVPNQIGSCTAITTGAWHSVDLATNGAGVEIGQLDGVTFAQSAAVTGGAISRVYFGCAFANSCKSDVYYDDMYINDSNTGGGQTFFASSTREDIRLTPNAAGDVNTFATQTGGTAGSANNYTRVFETIPDGATTFNGSATANQEDLFNVTDSGIGSSDTVNLVEYHDWYRASVASAEATFKPEIEKTSGGTISQGTAVTPNSTTFMPNTNALPNLPPLTLYVDPDGASWTKTTLDSMQIGYKITTGSTNRADLSTAYVYVEYVPAVTRPVTASTGLWYGWIEQWWGL